MSIFDAPKKDGCAVGIHMVVLGEEGTQISSGEDEWYGLERARANQMAMDMIGAIVGVIQKYREQMGEPDRLKQMADELRKQHGQYKAEQRRER